MKTTLSRIEFLSFNANKISVFVTNFRKTELTLNFTMNLPFPVLYREDVPQRKKKKKKNITFVYIQNVRAPLESSHEKIRKALIRFQLIISGVNATGKKYFRKYSPACIR